MKELKLKDISVKSGILSAVDPQELYPLPAPYDKTAELPGLKKITQEQESNFENNLDGFLAVGLPKPKDEEEEKIFIEMFISGLTKLFTKENNWSFLQPLLLSMEHCAQCQTCNEACPVYEASGRNELYRPNYRSEVFRKLYFKYIKPGNKLFKKFQYGDIELNWQLISRLFELSYRCTLCRRCAQNCPIGVDNALINHEIRKVFSQELGLAPKELHEKGTVNQIKIGSSTGMNPLGVKDTVEFIDEDISERTGIKVETKWDLEGADVLFIHNAGEFLSWPDNPGAFSLLAEMAGIKWTMSSEIAGYDGVNYGLFYDDVQFARLALMHQEIAKKLKVKKIVIGECGHSSKALAVISDRIINEVPRESGITWMENIVFSGKIKFDPERNNFPVTLHDPCNIVRNLGIVEPQRRILRYLAPKFREMTPHGVDNYCCGGGSGFAIMSQFNFTDWKMQISGRKKVEQIINAFKDEEPSVPKYVCAPCSNCKGQIRDLIEFYGMREKSNIYYDGLIELVVNSISDIPEGFIDFNIKYF